MTHKNSSSRQPRDERERLVAVLRVLDGYEGEILGVWRGPGTFATKRRRIQQLARRCSAECNRIHPTLLAEDGGP